MKISCASSLLLLFGLLSRPAGAATPEQVVACLNAVDLGCARQAVDQLLDERGEDAVVLGLAAETAFHEGRYEEAIAHLDKVGELHPDRREQTAIRLELFEATRDATEGMVELRAGQVVLRYADGMDAILVDEAVEALEAAQLALEVHLGSLPPQPVLVEIFPTGKRFVDASGLGQEAVSTTGVVAISKWARLLMTSPRAVARGYTWKDTLVHEYVHQVVSHVSQDRTPVWLQEGLARYLEACWRQVLNPPLDPFSQASVARALASDNLVTFEEMHPSFAFLDSAERGAVAYAQVQVLVATAVAQGGEGTLVRTLEGVNAGRDADQALAVAAGFDSFDDLMSASVQAMRELELVERKLAALPVVLDGSGDDFADDPLLAERADLAGFARLGDLLRLSERPRAALVEYGKAMPQDEPPSPLLYNRSADCHLALGDRARALELLRQATTDYPSFAMSWKGLADLEYERGELEDALHAYRASADVYPFDPVVQQRLAELYGKAGEPELAERHRGYGRVLLVGGEEL